MGTMSSAGGGELLTYEELVTHRYEGKGLLCVRILISMLVQDSLHTTQVLGGLLRWAQLSSVPLN